MYWIYIAVHVFRLLSHNLTFFYITLHGIYYRKTITHRYTRSATSFSNGLQIWYINHLHVGVLTTAHRSASALRCCCIAPSPVCNSTWKQRVLQYQGCHITRHTRLLYIGYHIEHTVATCSSPSVYTVSQSLSSASFVYFSKLCCGFLSG
jgi:hypothetical protein